MSTPLKLAALLITASMLSACGGGGGGAGGGDPVKPPPTPPTFKTTAEMAAFAEKGTPTVMKWVHDPKSGAYFEMPASNNTYTAVGKPWTRVKNCSNGVCVQVDRLAGNDIGLVQYTHGGQDFIYDLTGKPVANIKLPSGSYLGPMELRYRRTSDGQWELGTGDMAISLDMAKGLALMGGIVDYTASDGSESSIQVYADASVKNGELVNGITHINVDNYGEDPVTGETSGGVDAEFFEGEIHGLLSHGTNSDAIIGTVNGASNSGFQLSGGFISVSCLPTACR